MQRVDGEFHSKSAARFNNSYAIKTLEARTSQRDVWVLDPPAIVVAIMRKWSPLKTVLFWARKTMEICRSQYRW